MKTRYTLLVLVCLAVVITFTAAAQPCGSYSGTVMDAESGEPLPGANVLVQGKPGGTSTGVAGDFVIRATAGDTLRVSFTGYTSRQIILSDACTLAVRLAPAADELQTVVIQSEKLIAEEFTIKKIRKLDIYNNPSAKADPILAVNATPAATTTDESANISLRGSSPAETGIFFNNVPINDAVRYGQLNGIGTFSIFNTALVNQVQVYPGNPPLEYGGTTSGMISLSTDETLPDRPTNTVSLTLASFGAYTARRTGKRSSLTAFSNYQPSTFIKALNPKALERINNFESIDLGLHYVLAPNESTLFKVFTYGIRESYQFTYTHPTYEGNFNQEKNRMYTVINFRKRFSHSELTINNGLSASYARYFSGPLDVNLWQRDFFGAVNYQYFGGQAEFKAGLTYDTRAIRYQGRYPVYPYAFGDAYPTDSATSTQRYQVPEAYVYGKYFLTPRVTIGGGLRKNVVVGDTRDYLSYQLNVSYRPTKYVTLNLSGGRYNKYQLPQDEQALPFHIQAHQYSLDASLKKGDTEYSLSVFAKESQYLLTRSVVTGLEAFARYRISPRLRGQLSLTSLNASLTGGPSPYNIRYFLRGNLEYRPADTWTMTAVFLFREGSYSLPVVSATFDPALGVFAPTYGAATRLPAYRILDLSVSKIFPVGENSAIGFLSLSNVFGFQNVRGYSYNFDYTQAQDELFSLRTVYLGFVYNF